MHLRYDARADEPLTALFDRDELCQDHAFRNRMLNAVRNHFVMVDYHKSVTEDAIYMCGVLGESLGRRCHPQKGGDLVGDDAKVLREAIAAQRQSND